MKSIRPCCSFYHLGRRLSIRVPASMLSTETPTSGATGSLFQRVRMVQDPKASISPVLEQWNTKVRPITRREASKLIHQMKECKRVNHALEISQWMDDHLKSSLTQTDIAVRVDLISRVQGRNMAENYFKNAPSNLKGVNAYGALLSSYVAGKSIDKAEDMMLQMKKLGFAGTAFPYNMMIILYSQTGDLNKIETIISEMEKAGIPCDSRTLKDYMSACVSASNTAGMEKILRLLEADPSLATWDIYTLAANGYIKLGSKELGCTMLKEAEGILPDKQRNIAIGYLISLYATAGRGDEVRKIWDRYRASVKGDTIFATMISALVTLGDLEGAEEVFWAWDGRCTTEYDFRVLIPLLTGYCNNGLVDKAELVLRKVASGGRAPYVSCWKLLAHGYAGAGEMGKAVKMMKMAMGVGRQGWKPSWGIVRRCLEYLEARGDVEGVEEFVGLMRKTGPVGRDVCSCVVRSCLAAGRSVDGILEKMERDGFDVEEARRVVEAATNSQACAN